MSSVHLLQLPPEILAHIFMNLELQDIRNLMFSNKFLLNIILTNNSLWKSICKNQLLVRSSSDNRKPIALSCYNRYRISKNWCSGVYRKKLIIQHQVNYMPWLIFYDSEALLLSEGSELKCFPTDKKGLPVCKESSWKLESLPVKRNDIRTNDISRFVVKDNLILCGNRDGNATMYKFDHIRQKPTYLCHIRDCIENGLVEVSTVEMITSPANCYILTGSMYSSNLAHWKYEIDETNSKVSCCCKYSIIIHRSV
ncbi:unnamed protein product [Diatraea saccharalis]|uniref:F-box domain-containing protein n=1 Tax=Diatraea saccharalis TaxID=40085 RepID=A0A9N9RBG8_9NEOP|nr:unnamed protein product [Diatraea saccharalis]